MSKVLDSLFDFRLAVEALSDLLHKPKPSPAERICTSSSFKIEESKEIRLGDFYIVNIFCFDWVMYFIFQ